MVYILGRHLKEYKKLKLNLIKLFDTVCAKKRTLTGLAAIW